MSEWHLRKDVTVGNILTAITALIAAIAAYHNLNTRVSLVEQSIDDQHVHMKAEQEARKADVSRVCKRLDRIEELQIQVLRRIGE